MAEPSGELISIHRLSAAFACGAAVGMLGGLIGLGGAEIGLPILIGLFLFAALEAVILNKAMSLVVVASALPTRLRTQTLYKVIAVLMVAIAVVLMFGHHPTSGGQSPFDRVLQAVVGAGAGFIIGAVAALLGVAGGELLIPTLVLLFGANVKLAGSLSLAVRLPTMIAAFARYSRDQSFAVLGRNRLLVLVMAAGSIVGTFIGGQLLGIVPSQFLLPLLAAILLISAVKIWRHK